MRKKVLITGGAKGLGRSLASKFAENNYDIIITYLNSKLEAEQLQIELQTKYQITVQIFKVDLEKDNDIENLFKNIDTLDTLINNAAYNNDSNWQDKTRDQFIRILNVNTVSPFLMSKYAYPLLKHTKGTIINISSTNGIDTMYTESLDYDASKAALNNLTKSLSVAFSPDIRVNGIAAGWIDTHTTKDMDINFKKTQIEKINLNRFANPEEIANLAFFLACNQSSYMTGSIIRIDGGMKYGN